METAMQPMATIAARILAIASSKLQQESEPTVYACESCGDTGWIVRTGKGAELCDCEKRKRKEKRLARIPAEYRAFDLATVEPLASKHEKQAKLFAVVKANPAASLFLSGKNGCGKSMLGWLLYKQAVEDGRPVVFLTVSELMRQFREWEMDSEKLPAVDAFVLRNAKNRWLIVLDEAEKARPSEFASEKLCELLDAIYTHRHQLIVTSNFSANQLREHWSRQNEVYGGSIIRRIMELDGLIDVPMF